MSRKRRAEDETAPAPRSSRPWLPYAAIFLTFALVLAVRVRQLNVPLERDEGEYAYMGQLMLEGIVPYQLAANMKLPGTGAAYALIMSIFGQTPFGIHLGLLLINAAACLLLFLIGRRLFNTAAGLTAAASYAALSVGIGVLGLWAHATHFVVLPALGATLLLLKWEDSRRLWLLLLAGILFGVSFVMKQPGIFFLAFGAAIVLWQSRTKVRDLLFLLVGFPLPFGLSCLIVWRGGVFDRFWFWTFTYAREYAALVSLADGLWYLKRGMAGLVPPGWSVWLLAVVAFTLLWRKREQRQRAIWLTAFLACSFAAVCPGLHFREHYFVLLLPAVALLAGAAVATMDKPYAFGVGAGAVLFAGVMLAGPLLGPEPRRLARDVFGSNPFPESLELANYIRQHSTRDTRVAVLGSEPQIYFYSARHSATPYIYMYGLMEEQPFALRMQEELIRDIETTRPEYVVMVFGNDSWGRRKGSPSRLFDWWRDYGANNYEMVGVADPVSPDQTNYAWADEAAQYQPLSKSPVYVLRRKKG